jgi:hypothetical protein
MDLIREKRETIIKENNTAQERLNGILENLPKSSEVLEITEQNVLSGDLDFSVLQELGMGNVTTIILSEGEVTSIVGLPTNLKKLVCSHNLLTVIENLPTTLENLNISFNYLDSIDIGSLEVLESLNISHNRIEKLSNLPKTLSELLINDNKLGSLDLKEITNLKTLNISNNPITLIENLPEGIVDFVMENTPNIEFRNSDLGSLTTEEERQSKKEKEEEDEQQLSYEESLTEFFRLKNEYQTKVRKMKRDAYKKGSTKRMSRELVLSVKPACIHCKRPVGTLFSERIDNKYTILCGDKENPCKLNVQIFNGGNERTIETLELFGEELDTIKEKIIRQKLDTIFNYVSEEKSVEMFKKELDLYNSDSIIYKELLDTYVQQYHDPRKKEQINKKNENIFTLNEKIKELLNEYKKTGNPELLRLAVRIQIKEIYPEIRNRRMLENEVVELDREMVGQKEILSIFKYPIEISKIINNTGEKARVIKWEI